MQAKLKKRIYPSGQEFFFGNSRKFVKDILGATHQFIQECGDIFHIKSPIKKVVVISNPKYVKQVLLENAANYHKSFAYDFLARFLGKGLLTSEDETWKTHRKMIQPAFHKHKLQSLFEVMEDESRKLVEKLKKQGQTNDLCFEMVGLTLNIISRAIFSTGSDGFVETVSTNINFLNERANDKLKHPFALSNLFPFFADKKEKIAMQKIEAIIYNFIHERRKSGERKDDILDLLLHATDEDGKGMDDVQIRDEVMTLFIAGHETTALSLTWTCYLLEKNPAEKEKLLDEIKAVVGDEKLEVTHLDKLRYTKQIIEESMRLYPPAYIVGRNAQNDDIIDNYLIEKHTNVLIPIYLMHRMEKYWEEPHSFKPERFAPESRNQIDRFLYFPFGGGPRTCIGNHFAMMEMQIALTHIYRNLETHIHKDFTPDLEPLITLRPKQTVQAKFQALH